MANHRCPFTLDTVPPGDRVYLTEDGKIVYLFSRSSLCNHLITTASFRHPITRRELTEVEAALLAIFAGSKLVAEIIRATYTHRVKLHEDAQIRESLWTYLCDTAGDVLSAIESSAEDAAARCIGASDSAKEEEVLDACEDIECDITVYRRRISEALRMRYTEGCAVIDSHINRIAHASKNCREVFSEPVIMYAMQRLRDTKKRLTAGPRTPPSPNAQTSSILLTNLIRDLCDLRSVWPRDRQDTGAPLAALRLYR